MQPMATLISLKVRSQRASAKENREMIVQHPWTRMCGTAALTLAAILLQSSAYAQYTVTNLVSNRQGMAQHTDQALVNPWGVAFSPTGPFQIVDDGSGLSTSYTGKGVKTGTIKFPTAQTALT